VQRDVWGVSKRWFAPATTTCRASAGGCDVAEQCTGTNAACPPDTLVSAGTVCRASVGECDVAEACSGTNAECPVDAFKNGGAACADDNNPCTTDTCSGTSGACLHPAGNAGAVCRASAGTCDVAETCDGTSTACPTDAFAPSTTVCRSAVGACDTAETCSGASASCPADVFVTAGTICRAAAGDCDIAAACSGASASCPNNGVKKNGTTCSDGDSCTTGDACSGGVCLAGTPTCDKINVLQSVFQVISSPRMTFTQFSGDRAAATPGDPVVYTGVINNIGGALHIGNDVTLQNQGTSPFTITNFKMMIEVYSQAQSAWVPFGGVSYDVNYNNTLDPSLALFNFSEYLPFGPTNTTVGPHPVVGAVVGVGGSITWSSSLDGTLTPEQVHQLYNATGTSQIRVVTTFDTPAAPSPSKSATQDISTRLAGVTGAARNVRINMSYQTITPGNYVLGPSPTPLDAGQSVTITGTIVSPLIAQKGANETDAQYIARLRNDVFYGYFIGTAANADSVGGASSPQFYPPNSWGLALNIPILSVTKTGPATAGLGQALNYVVTVSNEGKSEAGGLSITDTVDGNIVAAPVSVPRIVDPVTGRLGTTLS
jgi:uncharacterized repeat protein (TIGR01451 family)